MTIGLVERFFASIAKAPDGGCWEWLGPLSSDDGYGRIGGQQAHRFSYTYHWGPIPPGMEVCHDCSLKRCVNPFHIYCGTRSDNLRDMVNAKGHLSLALLLQEAIDRHGGRERFAKKMSVSPETIDKWLTRRTVTRAKIRLQRAGVILLPVSSRRENAA